MAAVTDSETEVFEITDFTTASEWERFVSRVEEVLNEWKLTGNSVGKSAKEQGHYTSGTWEERAQEINFVDFKFSITHYALLQEHENNANVKLEEATFPSAMQDLLSTNSDFPPRAHCLVRCQVPMFVQIQQKWRRLYSGECQGHGVHTEFEMVHLRKVPSQYNHLSGLLDIFKSKTGCTIYPLPPINMAVRFTYILQDWQQYSWPLQPPDFDSLLEGEVGVQEFGTLPFGACEETISELHLSTTWPELTEGTVLDNDVYSELDPLHAPHWSLRVKTVEHPQCLLGDLLTDLLKLRARKETVEEILGRGSPEEEGKDITDISSALSKLTEPSGPVPMSKMSVSSIVNNARRHIQRHKFIDECPLGTDILNSLLQYLFPDASVDNTENKTAQRNSCGKPPKDTDELFIQLKSAPVESLTHRLALSTCLVNYYHGGLRAVAYLWQEFVLELRYRWENNYQICGLLGEEPPDLRCCLLHQKFQMLNYCIKRKNARDHICKNPESSKDPAFQNIHQLTEFTAVTSSTQIAAVSAGKSLDSWSDSEEEFFECLSDQGDTMCPCIRKEKDGNKTRAEGRMHPYNNMTLLNSSELLFIPVTQEPAPMTEDLLEEQSEIFTKLGTSAEGAQLRAQMQSACLLSDMESFKAANPGSVLEDFVRWYSPRDFLEEEMVNEKGQTVFKGHLSPRMNIPGNIWVETWENARAVPANRQRRLFDDTKEAEKVLHYLEVQKPADLICHLLPCIIHAAILKLKEEEAFDNIPAVRKNIQKATLQASKLLQKFNSDASNLEDSIEFLTALEMVIVQFRSLKTKFGIAETVSEEETEELTRFLKSLLEGPEVEVRGAGQGRVGGIIHRLFMNVEETVILDQETGLRMEEGRKQTEGDSKTQDFPSPAGREILLRTCIPRPAPYSKALPQRLFCVLTRDEFRLVGAFSSDTSFF
ncbi:rab3 GTPase-activating protein catalytic subunit isoform X1 [Syngnathoides biaculeatus]|uniref:rab3 GTPase-activating protein catalytic subunit isoform X1 n=1 Tax=Syngnathoides biaculeatus TaxID=300417 RepID=UPI002ADD740E|nr:rab3 GTPase-activating protein catalytic subunit isoform X1 [Syngnathoides biaculeatus]